MNKTLNFTRRLINLATTVHIKGLKAAVAAADRATDAAIDAEAQANRVKWAAVSEHALAKQAVDKAVSTASAVYEAAKAEIATLRPSEAARV
jgi:hypothetical protein